VIKVLNKIKEILERGNTAEVKRVKDGVVVLEVHRKIRYTDAVTYEEDEDIDDEDVTKKSGNSIDDGSLNDEAEV
jgi:hypothetical protein